MPNYYQFLIPRMNGEHIKRDFSSYLSLVKKGVAGFIVFGGRLAEIRRYLKRLQDSAALPLIISSDLERGLGQQIKGGTPFPPAMALAKASMKRGKKADDRYDLSLVKKAFRAVAEEAAYAGINTVFAPVLDINTNPKNPIIAARAFGEDADTVKTFGCEMIRTFQEHGIAACGKHFPGHGDTGVDSHIRLPVISRSLAELKKYELAPFRKAVGAGVKMLMLGHLSVPALDPSGLPVTLSGPAISFIRKKMRYRGMLITDAMNMGGIGMFSEEQASLMALEAGVDIVLHPTDPDRTASYLAAANPIVDAGRLDKFRNSLLRAPATDMPDFGKDYRLCEVLTRKAITTPAGFAFKGRPFLVVLNDEDDERGKVFVRALKKGIPGLGVRTINRASEQQIISIPEKVSAIVAIFSETKGWKGGAGNWLFTVLSRLQQRADVFISFGSPYLLDGIKATAKILVYWDSPVAQEAAAQLLLRHTRRLYR